MLILLRLLTAAVVAALLVLAAVILLPVRPTPPQEALAGATRNAAAALGLAQSVGTLEVGKVADFAQWAIDRPADLSYGLGFNPCTQVTNAGVARPAAITQSSANAPGNVEART